MTAAAAEALADAGWDKNGRKDREERTGVSDNNFILLRREQGMLF